MLPYGYACLKYRKQRKIFSDISKYSLLTPSRIKGILYYQKLKETMLSSSSHTVMEWIPKIKQP